MSQAQAQQSFWESHWGDQAHRGEAGSWRPLVQHHFYALLYGMLLRTGALTKRRPIRLIEPACGSGNFTSALVGLHDVGTFEVTLLDFTAAALRVAHEFVEANGLDARATYHYTQGSLLDLPYRDGSFDLAWNGGVMEHFDGEQRRATFREVARVLAPGGVYVCIVPNRLSPLEQASLRWARWRSGFTAFQRDFTMPELRSCVAGAGLELVAQDATDPMLTAKTVLRRGDGGGRPRATRHGGPYGALLSLLAPNIAVAGRKRGSEGAGLEAGMGSA